MEIKEPNTCIRGCCQSKTIPLHLPSSSYTISSSPIAKGSESVVYEGWLDGMRVAVKKPVLATSEDLDRFHKQLQLLCKLDHPGIATLVAAHAKPPNYMFFFKFYKSGNLAEKLHIEEWSPSVDQALRMAIQLAKALQYMHNLGIVHRDVKPANILVIIYYEFNLSLSSISEFCEFFLFKVVFFSILKSVAGSLQLDVNLFAHLADFGLAEYAADLKHVTGENWRSSGKPTGGFHKKNMVGTLIYMAPEILKKDVHTEKSDVYSFAITINELLTGVVPYTDLRAEAQAHTVLEMNYTKQQLTAAVVSEGLRPALVSPGSGVPSTLSSLIERCWDADSNSRPSFSDILFELVLIYEEVTRLGEQDEVHVQPVHGDEPLKGDIDIQVYREGIDWAVHGEEFSKGLSRDKQPGATFWLPSNDLSAHRPALSFGSYATCGRREQMEDTHFLLPNFSDHQDIHMFGIFDGHRGSAAAEFSACALPKLLQSSSTLSPAEALFKAFIETDAAFRSKLDMLRRSRGFVEKNWHPGCTAIVSLLIKNKLFIANAGDCRAILCRGGRAFALSRDHVASCIEERDRVTFSGGVVKWQVDTWRVGDAGLQVTRSIGDDDLKPTVTAEPEITETSLSAEDEYLVMASDGLWDVVSNEEIVNIIRDTVKEPSMCSKRLATEAAERGSKDNITVIVVFLRPVTTAERIY
ncbi:kinase and PP2C-like domain-containing protein [Drosera capensis]